MTSMDAESVATILCTAKQTRFNIATPSYRELDIEGLNITVKSESSQVRSTTQDSPSRTGTRTTTTTSATKKRQSASSSSSSSSSVKKSPKAQSIEILINAKLRLKAGQRYALVGRNGTGKSTLLRAIAEKLIPGIPEEMRVVLLQQTGSNTTASGAGADGESVGVDGGDDESGRGRGKPSVLDKVLEQATSKQQVQQEIDLLSQAVESTNPLGALKGLRRLKYDRLQRELFLKDKDARLRSGARGSQARKALREMEKKVQEYKTTQFDQPDQDITPEVLARETSEAADMLADLQLQVEPSRMAQVESQARKILAGLGFTDTTIHKPVSSLSGGWRMRTALAAALLQDTDLLILDEPTNFLDLLGILWLQRYLISVAKSSSSEDIGGAMSSTSSSTSPPPTLIIVSHDRDFISSLCTDLLIIRDKELTYFHGNLPSYESSQAEKRLHLTRMKDAQDRQRDHIQQTIQRNMREGKSRDDTNKIRQAKSRQKKLDDRMGIEVSSKGTRFKLNRDLVGFHLTSRAEIDIPQDEKPVRFSLPEPPELRFPGSLLSMENVSFRYHPSSSSSSSPAGSKATAATTPLVLQDINLTVHMGDRIGILGLNGSGKSTLIKLLVEGESRPATSTAAKSGGPVARHPRLRMGYYSQHAVEDLLSRARSQPDLTALSLVISDRQKAAVSAAYDSGGGNSGADHGQVRALLGTLGLPGRIASDVPLRKLSGGQLVRLEMARILSRKPQLLVLDEVTTHLDYETVRAMRAALRSWPGAVVLVSHDRWFMRGVVEGVASRSGNSAGAGDAGCEGGLSDLDDDDDDGNQDDGGGGTAHMPRRRLIYRIRAGKMSLLAGGVHEFEDSLEKRVRKLMSTAD